MGVLNAIRSFLAKHFIITSLVVLLGAVGSFFWTISIVVGPQWEATIARVDAGFEEVSKHRGPFSDEFVQIHQRFGRTNELPSRSQLEALAQDVRLTLDALASLEAPTRRIDKARSEYRASVNFLLGAINQYDESPDSYRITLNAFQTEANRGGDLLNAVESYTAGGIQSLWGTAF